MKYYHINKEANGDYFNAGEIVHTKEVAKFYETIKHNIDYVLSGEKFIRIDDVLDPKSSFDSEARKICNDSRAHYQKFLEREDIFENVRLALYPSLPSRKHCIFLTLVEDINYWLGRINTDHIQYKLFEVSICAEALVHETRDGVLDCRNLTNNQISRRAKTYWENGSSSGHKEILVEGNIKFERDVTHEFLLGRLMTTN